MAVAFVGGGPAIDYDNLGLLIFELQRNGVDAMPLVRYKEDR